MSLIPDYLPEIGGKTKAVAAPVITPLVTPTPSKNVVPPLTETSAKAGELKDKESLKEFNVPLVELATEPLQSGEATSSDKLKKIGAGFILLAILGGLLTCVCNSILSLFIDRTFEYSVYVGIIGMIIFLYKKKAIHTISVPGQEAWVTINALFPKRDYKSVDLPPEKLTVYKQGLHIIYPWEYVLPDRKIDLTKSQISIKSDSKKDGEHPVYIASDNGPMIGKWFATIRPDPDNLERYLAHKPEAITGYFTSLIDQKFSILISQRTVDQNQKTKDELSAVVAKVFGGKELSWPEWNYGVRIGDRDPVLSDLTMPQQEQDVLSVVARTAAQVKAAQLLMQASSENKDKNPMTLAEAMQAIRIMEQKTVEYILRGLENARDIYIHGMHPGNIAEGGGKGNKGSKSKGGK